MSQEVMNIVTWVAVSLNIFCLILNLKSFFKNLNAFFEWKKQTDLLKNKLDGMRQQLEYYKSRCYGAEKRAELLEEEVTKLRIKK